MRASFLKLGHMSYVMSFCCNVQLGDRLRHDSDAVLSKHMFDHALDTLPQWDAQSLTLLCTAIAGSRRAARAAVELAEGSEEAWQRIVLRLVELLPKAAPWQLASLARALMKVGASRTSVGPFYEALEQLLTSSNRSDLFSPTDLTFVVNGLAQHRCPQLQRLDAETLHLDKSVPMTSWEFEEYVGRKLHGFNSSELAVILHATMRLSPSECICGCALNADPTALFGSGYRN